MQFLHDTDVLIGASLRSIRKARGFSQAQLAGAMSEYGYTMQQQTVLKIEQGSRPLKAAELVALAAVLEVGLDELARGGTSSARADLLRARSEWWAAERDIQTYTRQVDEAAEKLDKARDRKAQAQAATEAAQQRLSKERGE